MCEETVEEGDGTCMIQEEETSPGCTRAVMRMCGLVVVVSAVGSVTRRGEEEGLVIVNKSHTLPGADRERQRHDRGEEGANSPANVRHNSVRVKMCGLVVSIYTLLGEGRGTTGEAWL
jgi:hypothetical protein